MKGSVTERLEKIAGRCFGIPILESMGLAIAVLDSDFNINWANTEYRKLQRPESKIIGKKCYQVSFNSDTPCPEDICAVRKTLKTKRNAQGLKTLRKDGEEKFLDVFSFPLHSSRGKVEYVVEVIQDNTKLHRLVESSNKLTAYASHQLKTPFATVYQLVKVLQEMDLPKGRREKLYDRIISRSQHGLKTVENFLIFSKIQAGGLEITPVKTEFYSKIIKEVLSFHTDYTLESGVKFTHKIPKNLQVICDPDYIEVVYNNLITNAIKHGGENLLIFLGYLDKGDEYHYFNVANIGEPIPQGKREKIFQRYVSGREKDSGIGLDVSREIIEKHKGKIWVEPCHFLKEKCLWTKEVENIGREGKKAELKEGNNFIFTIPKQLIESGKEKK